MTWRQKIFLEIVWIKKKKKGVQKGEKMMELTQEVSGIEMIAGQVLLLLV